MNKELEKRMYFFVPYNISPIQQAIQAGHAALEYARTYSDDLEYIDFVDNWKTWIILNGGTTNYSLVDGVVNVRSSEAPYKGTLDNLAHQLIGRKINFSLFQEPDLNDALTAICFICDERVFNYSDYPDFKEYFLARYGVKGKNKDIDKYLSYDELKEKYEGEFIEWTKTLGEGVFSVGKNNVFLRELLKGKKLA